MSRVIEGTWEQIKAYEAEFAGHHLRVIVDPDDRETPQIPAEPPH